MNYLSETTTRMRRLGGFEKLFSLIDQSGPTHFAVAAKIEGQTTTGGWRTALDLVQRRHPSFSVGIEQEGTGAAYFSRAAARIPLRIVASDDLRWEPEIEREMAAPFNANRAPLVRAVLVHQPHRAVFILVSRHSIADARSLIFAIRDVLQAFSGKFADPLPSSLDALLAVPAEDAECAAADSCRGFQPVRLTARSRMS